MSRVREGECVYVCVRYDRAQTLMMAMVVVMVHLYNHYYKMNGCQRSRIKETRRCYASQFLLCCMAQCSPFLFKMWLDLQQT